MQNPYKKITAQLLLFSFLLESCYNPNIGIGKQALPTPDPADKQRQYAGEPHDKYPPKPTSHTWTTADKHPITFTYHNGQWQAAIKEHAANGSSQRRQVPVVFEPGLTIEDVVDSNPTQQKQLLHLCPSQEDPDQPSYVYVGREPSQAKSQPQLLSSPAARQTTPRNEVELAQQQATTQPHQGGTSPQQAQEQPGRQAVLALTGPVQQIGESPRSQGQLQATPARATSKPLPAPSREIPSQGVANTQPTSPQRVSSRRALSWRNQHELLHSQRAAQAKREQSAAMAKPGNQLAQPAAPSQAIVSLTPAHPPSLAHKAPQGIASQNLLAQGGHPVRFMHQDGQWWASVRERIGVFSRVWVLPVACQGHGDVAKALADLQDKPTQYTQRRIHVMHTQQTPYVPQFVYLGAQGLRGGGNGAGEASGSGEPQDEPATGGQEGAQGREPSQAAPQDREASLRTLKARMEQGDITSTQGLVEALNAAQGEEQPALQQWIRRYIEWFNDQTEHVGNLASIPEEIQECASLAHIKANTEENRRLLKSYFYSLCNKVKQGQYGEEPLLRALEYTLQNMDSEVFGGDPSKLITLGKDLLAKLDTDSNQFTKATYPTYRSTLYALHQTLVLVQGIAPGQWDEGIYNRFKKKVEAIADNDEYYPFCYHALLLAQILERLKSEKYRARLKRMRIVDGLRAGLAIGQVVVSAAAFKLDTDAIQQICKSLQAAFSREGIEAKSWYDRYQDIVQCIHALEDIEGEIKDFLGNCQSLKDAFASENMEEKTWYDWHQALKYASLLSLGDASKYSVFEQGLESVQKAKLKNETKEGRKALGFGIVQQLRLLALHGPSGEVRKQSIQWLEALANPEAWGGDPAVMEGLLDGLAAIAVQSQGAEQEQAEKALKSLTDSPPRAKRTSSLGRLPSGNCFSWGPEVSTALREVAAKKALQAWLGGQELADKLSAISAPSETPASGDLFRTIHSLLSAEAPVASQAPADAQAARQKLRKYYQHPDFAQVKSLFEEEKPKHVDSLACQLMLTEPVQKQADGEGQQTDVSTYHERLEWVKNPIALEDLFKKRKTKPDGPEQAIQKVLLVGEPGTGKTTLSKKMASLWAQGKWGQEFNAVYVLPVRALQQSQYDNVSMRRDETLPTAIANNCFAIPPTQGKEYERLRDQISEELAQPTTLVVLDGLDERYGASEALLSQAKAGTHKLLLLSRPYGIETERKLVDIEIAHAGFNDGQMEAYVRGDLPELGEELLQFIKAYPAITSIAHVPVNLQILCALWKDDGAGVRAETSNGSLPGLYRMLTEYTCNRYEERQRNMHVALPYTDRQELFDKLGQVALKGLEQGEVLISEGLVGKVLGVDAKIKAMLKDSGFLLLEEVGKQYQFPHLTFQEYFAGRALAKQLLSGNAEDQEEVQDFLSEHKYKPQYGQMLSFFAGEVSKGPKKKGIKGIRQVLSLLEKEPQEVAGVQHVLLQMRLLNEWLCVAGKKRQEGLARLEAEFPVMASLEEWFCEGVDRVRRGDDRDDRRLLSLLTRGLQSARAVAGQAEKVLPPLLEALRDQNDPYGSVRSAAIRDLGKVVEAAPGQAEKVLPPLLEALRDQNDPYGSVRRAASSALGRLAQAAPEQAAQVLEPLLAASKDKYADVREPASRALAEVAKAAPALAEKVLPPLLAASKDNDGDVRDAASRALAEVAKAAPEKVLEPLLAASKDSYVRDAASRALAAVAQAAPELAAKVLEPLIAAAKDSSFYVREAASDALAEVAKAAPALAEKVLPPLLEAMRDKNWNVRRAASDALGKVVEAAPGQAEKVLPPLLEAMRDADYEVRYYASYALGEVGKAAPGQAAQVLPPLLEAMRDKNWNVRRAASDALGKVVEAAPGQAEKVLPPLLEAMRDADYEVRYYASYALGEVGKAAPGQAAQVLPPLLEAMRDADYEVRYYASYALGEVGKAAPGQAAQVLPPLLEAMRDADYEVRRAASYALGEVGKAAPGQAAQVLPPLLEAMRDADDGVRYYASYALGEVGKAAPGQAAQVLPPLLEAMRDSDDEVRRAASYALVSVGKAAPGQAAQVLPPLIEAMQNSDYEVRRAASYALGEVGKAAPGQAAQVLPPLLEAMRDSDEWVRRAASYALGQVGKAAPGQAAQVLPPLLEAMRDADYDVRRAARYALGQVGKAAPGQAAQVLPPLLEAMRDSDEWVRRAASYALGQVGKAAPGQAAQVLPPLLEAMRDADYDVRRAARYALGQVGKAAPAHAPALVEPLLAACKDSDEDVRRAAREALGQVVQAAPAHAAQVLEPLLAACKDSDEDVRRAAREALGSVGKAAPAHAPALLEPLLAACKDSDEDVRRAASSALGQFSLQQLIDGYWATQDQVLIPLIAPRLYQTPLSVQTIPHAQDQRLVLYPSAGERVVWNKPHQAVQDFVQRIQGAAKQWTPLMSAAAKGNLALAQSLVDQGAAVNQATADGRTPLVIAAEKGHLALAQLLVDQGAAVNQATADGRTPLMIAAQNNHLKVAQFLVEKGAGVNQPNKDGVTPLYIAAENGHLELAQFLVKKGATVDQAATDGRTPLWIAAEKGHLALAQLLVDQGAAVNQATADGRTPLMIAAEKGHLALAKSLVDQGAAVNQANKDGWTPLWIAASNGRLEVAQYLVEKGAGVNQANKDGWTPLMSAAQNGQLELAQLLVDKGADVNQATSKGRTPLMIATQNGHAAVVQFLEGQGAGVNP